jgi:hypothetical protein
VWTISESLDFLCHSQPKGHFPAAWGSWRRQ